MKLFDDVTFSCKNHVIKLKFNEQLLKFQFDLKMWLQERKGSIFISKISDNDIKNKVKY